MKGDSFMELVFNNGQKITAINIHEQKRIYSAPQRWELKISATDNLSSDELDDLLVPDNISYMEYEIDDETKVISGYDTVDFLSKTIAEDATGTRITLDITLLKEMKEDEENESQI